MVGNWNPLSFKVFLLHLWFPLVVHRQAGASKLPILFCLCFLRQTDSPYRVSPARARSFPQPWWIIGYARRIFIPKVELIKHYVTAGVFFSIKCVRKWRIDFYHRKNKCLGLWIACALSTRLLQTDFPGVHILCVKIHIWDEVTSLQWKDRYKWDIKLINPSSLSGYLPSCII